MNKRYDKEAVEKEALKSKEQGRITERLGLFIIERASEIVQSEYNPHYGEYRQAIIDHSVMYVCEQFLQRYREGGSAANLIIGMIYSSSIDRVRATSWKDVYGEKNKSYGSVISDEGKRMFKLVQTKKDDHLSAFLSGSGTNHLINV